MKGLNKKIIGLSVAVFATGFLVFSSFPQSVKVASGADVSDTESSIEKTAKQIKEEMEKKARYESDVQRLQGAVNSTQSVINQTANVIETTEETISRKEKEVERIEASIEKQKDVLRRLIQESYYNYNQPAVYFVTGSDNFSQIVSTRDHLSSLKKKVVVMVDSIKESQSNLEKEKEELEGKKEEHEDILQEKQAEKSSLVSEKQVFEEKVAQKEATIGELQQKMNELRNDLNRILGKSYDTGEIKDAIKFANKVTGVRKGFLFGMLSMESGGNPLAGNCTYTDSIMTTTRKKYFKQICEELDYNYKKRPVSCASKSYPGSGGAMGAAQFMSDTWMGYKSKIASATGNNPPDPWDLLDGVVAMALKLENDGATESGKVSIKNPCNGKSVKVDWEIYASMKYLGWTCYGYTNYAPGIQSLAKGYDNL
ncbi:MAG: Uncharacterized protein Athens071425_44 [Parcubacteria group bacterium Athens0714_25]|nr:MAG: Uncharacterized protein Athens071425_44 [Parcubacteria group bacterium Athens0714_25]